MMLMMIGNAGIVVVIVSATSSVISIGGSWQTLVLFSVILIYVYVLYILARYGGITKRWEEFINKRFVSYSVEEGTPAELLHLLEGYGIVKVPVKPDSPTLGSCLSQETCRDNGLLVIGIERDNQWIPLPQGDERTSEGDFLVVYGPLDTLKNTFRKGPVEG